MSTIIKSNVTFTGNPRDYADQISKSAQDIIDDFTNKVVSDGGVINDSAAVSDAANFLKNNNLIGRVVSICSPNYAYKLDGGGNVIKLYSIYGNDLNYSSTSSANISLNNSLAFTTIDMPDNAALETDDIFFANNTSWGVFQSAEAPDALRDSFSTIGSLDYYWYPVRWLRARNNGGISATSIRNDWSPSNTDSNTLLTTLSYVPADNYEGVGSISSNLNQVQAFANGIAERTVDDLLFDSRTLKGRYLVNGRLQQNAYNLQSVTRGAEFIVIADIRDDDAILINAFLDGKYT